MDAGQDLLESMAELEASARELREAAATLNESTALLLPHWWCLDEDPRQKRPAALRVKRWPKPERRAAAEVARVIAAAVTEDDDAGRKPRWHAVEPPCCGPYLAVLCRFDELVVDVSLYSHGSNGRHLRRNELLMLTDLGFQLDLADRIGSLAVSFDPRRPDQAWQLAGRIVVAVLRAVHHTDCGTPSAALDGEWLTFPWARDADESSDPASSPTSAEPVHVTAEYVRQRAQEDFEESGTERVYLVPVGEPAVWHGLVRAGRSSEMFVRVWDTTAATTLDGCVERVERWIATRKRPLRWEWATFD